MRGFQSGMADARDAIERDEKGLPDAALAGEDLSSWWREPVISATALAGALHPPPFDEALVFEAIQRGIQGGDVEVDGAVGPLGNEPADLIAVALALFEEREDEQLGAAPFQLALEKRRAHMWAQHI